MLTKRTSESRPQKNYIVLGSIGEPLTQCTSVHHILRVFFDLMTRRLFIRPRESILMMFLVHERLLDQGLLQGDIEFNSILCNPNHNPSTLNGRRKSPIPSNYRSIGEILYVFPFHVEL
jgi:hypothetical protein